MEYVLVAFIAVLLAAFALGARAAAAREAALQEKLHDALASLTPKEFRQRQFERERVEVEATGPDDREFVTEATRTRLASRMGRFY